MESSLPLLFAAAVGFSHAFEADHLVAVSSLVSKRRKPWKAIKDGIYWGLGHSSTIFLIGIIMIVWKATFLNDYFQYFEAVVGVMLVVLGLYRLIEYKNKSKHKHEEHEADEHGHKTAYGVGLVHGLAGSGALVLLVMAEIKSVTNSLLYLIIFGLGSVVGMLVAAGVFSLPFSKKITQNKILLFSLVLLSSMLCIGYGGFVIWENLLS